MKEDVQELYLESLRDEKLKLKAYYLPKFLEDIEEELDKEELKVDGYSIAYPKITKEVIKKVAKGLREKRDEVYQKDFINTQLIANTIENLKNTWLNDNYEKRKIALEILPKLTGLSVEQIIFYQFGTIAKMDKNAVEFLMSLELDSNILRPVIPR